MPLLAFSLLEAMRAHKLNAEEREQLRRQRSEARLIIARCKERRFEYVVNPPEIPKVAFGTTMDREVMPTSGPFMDSYMRRNMPEVRPTPGPFTYEAEKWNTIGFKYPSKSGFSAFANKMTRLPVLGDLGYPPLGSYAPETWKESNFTSYTFNKQLLSREPKWMSPGASTYSHHTKYPYWNLETAFGHCRIIWPAVAVFCGPWNTALCMTCHQQPIGDYFHNFGTNQDMCRVCMKKQMDVIKHCSLQVVERYRLRRDIKQFKPARYCGFFHDHSGTTAAREMTSRKQLREKIRVENYLYRFVAKSD